MAAPKIQSAAIFVLGTLALAAGLSFLAWRHYFRHIEDVPANPAAKAPAAANADFYADFRNGKPWGADFRLIKPQHADRLTPEAEGLRLTHLPEDKPEAVGFALKRKIVGDFEVTVGYEMVHVDQPKGGWGAGIEIWAQSSAPHKDFFGFNRIVLADGRDVFWSGHMTADETGQRALRPGKYVPATARAGQLRITRRGTKVALSAKENGADEFQQLFEWEFGAEDLATLRFAANPGGGAALGVEVRLHDIRVRGL